MSTSRAFLRSIGRIHDLCPNAFLGKLIACLELHLPIWPPTNLLSKVLALLQRCFSGIAKVFEHDHPSIGLDSILGQGFRSNMQKMFRNGPFAVCQSLQKAMGGPGTYSLNSRPSLSNTLPQMIKFSAIKKEGFIIGGIRSNKHTLDARIYSYNGTLLNRFRDFFFIAENQIKFIFNKFKFRILPGILRDIGMMHRNGFSPEGDTISGFIEVSFPDQGKSGIFKNGQFPSFIGLSGLIGCGNMLANTAGKLTGKFKFFTKGWVMGLGESISVHLFGVESYRTEPIEGQEIIFNYLRGFRGAFNFNFGSTDDFHYTCPLVSM
jgi:hypothetical protein